MAGALCLCCPPAPLLAAQAAAPPSSPPPRWAYDYGAVEAQQQWGGTCATSLVQSPIDIPFDPRHPPLTDGGLALLNPAFPRYLKDGATVVNTGHGTMQVGGAGAGGGVVAGATSLGCAVDGGGLRHA